METLTLRQELEQWADKLDAMDAEGLGWYGDKGDSCCTFCKECMAYRLLKEWSVLDRVIVLDPDDSDEPVECSVCEYGSVSREDERFNDRWIE